jgi:hypothetical protein
MRQFIIYQILVPALLFLIYMCALAEVNINVL